MYEVLVGGTVEEVSGGRLVHRGMGRTVARGDFESGPDLADAMHAEAEDTDQAVYIVNARGTVVEYIDERGRHHEG